jgi:hypothetical protein
MSRNFDPLSNSNILVSIIRLTIFVWSVVPRTAWSLNWFIYTAFRIFFYTYLHLQIKYFLHFGELHGWCFECTIERLSLFRYVTFHCFKIIRHEYFTWTRELAKYWFVLDKRFFSSTQPTADHANRDDMRLYPNKNATFKIMLKFTIFDTRVKRDSIKITWQVLIMVQINLLGAEFLQQQQWKHKPNRTKHMSVK